MCLLCCMLLDIVSTRAHFQLASKLRGHFQTVASLVTVEEVVIVCCREKKMHSSRRT